MKRAGFPPALRCSLILLIFCGGPLFPQRFDGPERPDALARLLIERMSDEEALAQTFMFGWVGAEPSPLILDWIRERRIGGVKIFGWNTGDTLKLAAAVGALQEAALASPLGVPLFVATDQEGGWIRHVKGATSETPGNMAIGASGFPRDAYLSGYYIGRELAALGINMNFAPTVDLYTNRDSTLIGPRAFGSDPVQAGILGAAFMKGQSAAGIIATAKHYPGHGDTDLDSHGVLPRIGASFEALWDRELVPYRILAREGIPAVMSGHLAFPNTQAAMTPASLSPWFLQDVLRERIGFQGLIVTDDLMMNGAAMSAGSVSQAAKEALMAGNDIILVSKTPGLYEPVWLNLTAAMRGEPAFRARVRAAAQRVLAAKLTYLRGERAAPRIPDLAQVERSVPDPQGAAFFLDLAARSATVVKGGDASGVIPLMPEQAGRVLLAGQFEDFFTAGKRAYPGAVTCFYAGGTGAARGAGQADLPRLARQSDTIIFCISSAAGLGPLESIKSLGKKVILFSVLSPAFVNSAPWVDGAIAVYSYSPESFVAGFSALLGRISAGGRLPFVRPAP
ncbi:MAG: glycoside hydrolase family 3 protein [Treponema sp.]|nr:glycoside hydrolase family 3 protein [Treponema sp.]